MRAGGPRYRRDTGGVGRYPQARCVLRLGDVQYVNEKLVFRLADRLWDRYDRHWTYRDRGDRKTWLTDKEVSNRKAD